MHREAVLLFGRLPIFPVQGSNFFLHAEGFISFSSAYRRMRAICNAGWREIVRRPARLTSELRMLAALLCIERVFVLSKACVMVLLHIKCVSCLYAFFCAGKSARLAAMGGFASAVAEEISGIEHPVSHFRR